jgi:biopolymer transport protein ExbD
MAELNSGDEGKKKGKKKGSKKLPAHIDMTPMVDLGFLLITFFMLTVTLSKPQTMEINMPSNKKDDSPPTKIAASKAMTIILGQKDRVFYYFGTRDKGVDPKVVKTDYSPEGIRAVLLAKNDTTAKKMNDLHKELKDQKITQDTFKAKASRIKKGKSGPIVVIKAMDESTYKNFVDILDEMNICSIARFAVVDITDLDKELIKPVDN